MKRAVILLILVAAAAAFAPRARRAVEEEQQLSTQTTTQVLTTTTATPVQICAPQTPCAWSIYKPLFRIIEFNVTNTYCICSPETVCRITEDDTSVGALVFRCRLPLAEGEEDEFYDLT